MGKGALGLGSVEVRSSLVGLALGLLESGVGHLLSQYGSEFGGEAISKVLELGVASGGGNGEIRVEEIVNEGVVKSRGICNGGGEGGTAAAVDEEGGGVGSLRSRASEMET